MDRGINQCIGGLFEESLLKKANATSNIALLFEIKYSPVLGNDGKIDWSYYQSMLPKVLIGCVLSAEEEEQMLKALESASSDPAISHSVLAVFGKCESKSGLAALFGVLKKRVGSLNEKECDQALFSLIRFSDALGAKFKEWADTNLLNEFIRQCRKFSSSKDYVERLKMLELAAQK